MKNNIILYGLLAGASFLAYKHFTKKKVNAMEVVDADELYPNELEVKPMTKEEEIKRKKDKLRLVKGGGKTVRVPVSSQTIRL